ncbi:PfkB family carbohydrate kinase [Streptomyces shenzhenensis]|uniref:PfkB family carbohydrate kinase n=1 Tax=Streptomyces shenzhenensis TaxID=943815 RepID=UPI0015F04A1E|nr:PfkB family carbohydrate kinase [Streptomyces shenzhenensis]
MAVAPGGTSASAIPARLGPETRVVDTLGAGDVLHGALAHHLSGLGRIDGPAFAKALARAAAVASRACASFGTRVWLTAD